MRKLILGFLIAAGLVFGQTHETRGTTPDGSGGAGSGKVLVSTASASASATLDFDTVFDSTYDVYEIEIDSIIPATSDTHLQARFRSGGSYQTTSYDAASVVESAGSGVSDSTRPTTLIPIVSSSTSNFGISNAASGAGGWAVCRVYQASSATRHAHISCRQEYENPTPRSMYGRSNGTWTGGGGAVTGIQFLMSSGNITSGTIRIWGLPKS